MCIWFMWKKKTGELCFRNICVLWMTFLSFLMWIYKWKMSHFYSLFGVTFLPQYIAQSVCWWIICNGILKSERFRIAGCLSVCNGLKHKWLRKNFRTFKENPGVFVMYSSCNTTVMKDVFFFFFFFLSPHTHAKLMV